jgi:hypothetical protein
MNLELTEKDREVISHALKVYLSDLREEIVKTEKHEMKVDLHQEEDILKETLRKLA